MPTDTPTVVDERNDELAVALVLYGMLSYVLVLFWAVNTTRLCLRTYQMIGHSLSMFVGVLMFQTFDTIINDLLQGGDQNENSLDIPLSVVTFVLWNLLAFLLITEFRRKPLLQKGSSIIVGHTAGFACINIATIVQTASFNQSDGMAVLYVFVVLIVLLVGYIVIYFLLELLITLCLAMKHSRRRRRQRAVEGSQASTPDIPMAEGREPKPTYALRYRRRMSQPPSSTKLCLLRFVGHVIASTMAFITIQACTFLIYGEYPGVTLKPPREKVVAELYMWLVVSCSAASVLVVNVIAANQSAKHFLTRGTWPGEICFDAVHKFIHLCLAWSLLLASYWLLAQLYDPGTSESVWALTNSIVYSIASIVALWVLSEAELRCVVYVVVMKFVNLLGVSSCLYSRGEQRGSLGIIKFHVAPMIIEGFVWATSLLIGYSWKLVFTEAQNAVMDTDRWGLRILTSAMNFGLMVPVYFRYILPKMDPQSPLIDQDTQTTEWKIFRAHSALW